MQGEEGEETTRGIAKSRLVRNVVALPPRPVASSVRLKFRSVQVPPSLERLGGTTNGRALALEHIFQ